MGSHWLDLGIAIDRLLPGHGLAIGFSLASPWLIRGFSLGSPWVSLGYPWVLIGFSSGYRRVIIGSWGAYPVPNPRDICNEGVPCRFCAKRSAALTSLNKDASKKWKGSCRSRARHGCCPNQGSKKGSAGFHHVVWIIWVRV